MMISMKFILVILTIVLVASLVSVWLVPSIQDFMAGNTMWNGVRDFQQSTGTKEISSLEYVSDKPETAVVIVIPYTGYSEDDTTKLSSFLREGGTVVLLDDFGFSNSILEKLALDVRFSGALLLDPLFCYKNQYLPKITDFSNFVANQGIEQVILNHATVLLNTDNTDIIAWSSPTSFLDIDDSGDWNSDEPKGPLPVAAKIPVDKGMLVLASDPSLVINSMVNRNNNFDFIKALTDTDGKKEEILFDTSHLSETPLDVSKSWLTKLRETLRTPYPSLALLLIIFVTTSRFMLVTGG